MVFSSAVFLFAFLPLTIFGYFLLPRKWRNAYLMLASLVFYAWGEPKFVLVMIASILMNYLLDFWSSERRTKPVGSGSWC